MALANDKHATENEAAVALKQAKALMDEYEVSEADLVLSSIKEFGTNTAKTLPMWHWDLIHLCGSVFNCSAYQYERYSVKTQIKFIGLSSNPEMCTYAYEVLIRQLKKARLNFIKTQLNRVKITKNKTYRADQFCKGWVYSVRSLLRDFIQTDKDQEELIKQYKEKHLNLGVAKTRDIKNISKHVINDNDHYAGLSAGKQAQLHQATTYQGADAFLE